MPRQSGSPPSSALEILCWTSGGGVGHYLVSLRRHVSVPFHYTGLDGTKEYVERGQRIFGDGANGVDFVHGDIFDLPFEDASFDVVMCNNVLLHLPTIEVPIRELVRVARRFVLIRALVGRTSFIIKEVRTDEYDERGEPASFNFYNIYSERRIRAAVQSLGKIDVRIEADRDFEGEKINADLPAYGHDTNLTRVVNGMQLRDYIVQPWSFISLTKG